MEFLNFFGDLRVEFLLTRFSKKIRVPNFFLISRLLKNKCDQNKVGWWWTCTCPPQFLAPPYSVITINTNTAKEGLWPAYDHVSTDRIIDAEPTNMKTKILITDLED